MKVIALACALAAGCSLIAQGQVRKYDRRVAGFEQLKPDGEALHRGDTRTTKDMVKQFDDWTGYIQGQAKLPPVDRQKLVDRMQAARRRYLLAAAPLADSPDLGYAIANSVLAAGDADGLALVRKLSDERAVRRQHLFSTQHTYSTVKDGEMVMATTDSSVSIVNGRVVNQYSSSSLVTKPGNCVFATRPFGPEGTQNPGLTFRLVGKAPSIYVRCYLSHDLGALPDREGELIATVPLAYDRFELRFPRPAHADGQRTFDFVLQGNFVDNRQAFAGLVVSLVYSYTKDLVVVWEDGRQRLRKERPKESLAASPVFWDRDGELPSTVASPISDRPRTDAAAPPARPAPAASRRSPRTSR